MTENLTVGIGSHANENKDVYRAQYLESDGFLLLQQLNRLCVYIDFEWFLPKQI